MGLKYRSGPDLREAHDAICNKGISRADISVKFPHLNFSECPEEWNHPPHTIEAVTIRAEKVRGRLKELSKVYNNIVLITHRGFIAFLVKGDRYDVCETRSYRFATDEETEADSLRFGVNVDTKAQQDFGPTERRIDNYAPKLPRRVYGVSMQQEFVHEKDGCEKTYPELLSDIIHTRNLVRGHLPGFDQQGLLRGHHVYIAVVSCSVYEFMIAFFAVCAIGGVNVILHECAA
ncbi:hypothetical protein L228DRAFT_261160 [Xylona heveae TC161]|uniref:Phosphoglycerate mutase-like protein n=1 Tax=Xylona heveae (strain CBS 132557 / TC161) TaxID=1328760 RepID=A0A165H6M3_XYLHT|nr:hypothetical protein L228DRAFT_261160 [Xylona heveae TC161]KZF23058.1 hypothetical protein L228DRAFT_261160 [Xylona heveae TC161]